MPPKARKLAMKPAPSKKARTQTSAPASTDAPAEVNGSNKRRAQSELEVEENASKKSRAEEPAQVNAANEEEKDLDASTKGDCSGGKELDESTKKGLQEMRFTLADHSLRSMGALMDAIGFTDARPTSVEEMVDAVIDTLEKRVLSGKDITADVAAVAKIDENHWEGEYDSDPDGFDKITRRRLNKVEDMVGRLTKQFLKDIFKQLHSYGRGGTNKDLAAEVVAMLTYKAEEGSKLKHEYRVVKDVYSMCYGGCGGDSGLDSGDSADGEGDEHDESDEDDHDASKRWR